MDNSVKDPFDQSNPARARSQADAPASMQAPERRPAEELTRRKAKRGLEKFLIIPVLIALVVWLFYPQARRGPVIPKVDPSATSADNGPGVVGAAKDAAAESQAAARAEAAKQAQAAEQRKANDPNAMAAAAIGGTDAAGSHGVQPSPSQVAANQQAAADLARRVREEAEKQAEKAAEIAASPLQGGSVELIKADASGQKGVGDAGDSPELARLRMLRQSLASGGDANGAMEKAMQLAASYVGQGNAHAAAPAVGTAAQQDKWLSSRKAEGEEVTSMHVKPSGYLISQGTPVRTVLITGLDTDSPGMVTALVTSDVFDSATGTALLIPRGSRVVGEYNHDVQKGQTRVLVALTRLIRPDGSWIDLSGATGAEMNGQAGLVGDVNNHFFKIFGSSLMIGAATLLLNKSQTSTTVSQGIGTTQMGGTIFAQTLQQVLSDLLSRNREIPPTITRDEGTEFIFMVRRDLSLAPYQRI